jgi:hypothetical protein
MSRKPKLEVWRTYYRKGIVVLEEHYLDGIPHGRRRWWHRNGQLAEEQTYCHGVIHGLCRQWNDRGRLLGSFHVEHGTGRQKSWHDNGRLQMEFTLVEGQFCGSNRTWLRDGTLDSDTVLLFDREVTPHQYRQAAAKDARLPKLLGQTGKPALKGRALKQHSYRLFVAWLLAKRNRSEVREWLTAETKTKRTLGRFKRASAAVQFVEELYQAGAVKVIAPEIYQNKRGDQFADCLLVQLPKTAAQRKAIYQVCEQLEKDDLGASSPDQARGESYLYISMG